MDVYEKKQLTPEHRKSTSYSQRYSKGLCSVWPQHKKHASFNHTALILEKCDSKETGNLHPTILSPQLTKYAHQQTMQWARRTQRSSSKTVINILTVLCNLILPATVVYQIKLIIEKASGCLSVPSKILEQSQNTVTNTQAGDSMLLNHTSNLLSPAWVCQH